MNKGIDVSRWQGTIDWAKVKASGIQFAMIRGGYGKHKDQIDAYFEINYKGAKKAGVPVGVYHYSYAESVEDAQKEAEFVKSYLKGKKLEYPVAFDIEDKVQGRLTNERRTEICKAFCDAMEKAGYYVVIYSSKDWLVNKLNMSKLSKYDVWVAQWNTECTYTGNYGLWQYSDKGEVKGISGNVDLDEAYKDYPTIMKNKGLNGYTKVSKPTKPTEPSKPKTYKKGDAVKLINASIYASATDKIIRAKKSGKYYIYDGIETNGRYRITIRKTFCGKKPIGLFVTGWVSKSNLK